MQQNKFRFPKNLNRNTVEKSKKKKILHKAKSIFLRGEAKFVFAPLVLFEPSIAESMDNEKFSASIPEYESGELDIGRDILRSNLESF